MKTGTERLAVCRGNARSAAIARLRQTPGLMVVPASLGGVVHACEPGLAASAALLQQHNWDRALVSFEVGDREALGVQQRESRRSPEQPVVTARSRGRIHLILALTQA